MAFLDEFLGKQDYARSYLFYAKILQTGTSSVDFGDDHKFLVKSTSLPESTIESMDVHMQGQILKIASTQTFGEWSCTFNADIDMNLRSKFQEWKNAVYNPSNNLHGSPSQYFGTIEITMLSPYSESGDDSSVIYETQLYQAWPSVIAAIDLAYDTKEVSSFDVTFTYGYHLEGKSLD